MWAGAPGLPLKYFVISQVKTLPFQILFPITKINYFLISSQTQPKEYHGDGVRETRRLRKLRYYYNSIPVGAPHVISYRGNNMLQAHMLEPCGDG